MASSSNSSFERAAIGIKAHSGWAAIVAVQGTYFKPKILARQRINLIDPKDGICQPYHHAKQLEFGEAKKFLDHAAATSARFARGELVQLSQRIREGGYELTDSCIVLASGRPLPSLRQILASHPLMHAAEGEFFRGAIREACRELNVPNTGVVERKILEQSASKFGVDVPALKAHLNTLGRSLGPPWTVDQKHAFLAGLLVSVIS
jgi:hypothetical protein